MRPVVILATCLAISLSACSSFQADRDQGEILGSWQLAHARVNGKIIAVQQLDRPFTLTFSDAEGDAQGTERVFGKSECNSLGGSYIADAQGNLKLFDVIQTEVGCSEANHILEQAVHKWTTGARFASSGAGLIVNHGPDRLIFKAVDSPS